jgi:cytochrome c|tara:strand:- start:2088 stop:2612 length:525 start_codon:yes stop_codon:yes gene_type:complete
MDSFEISKIFTAIFLVVVFVIGIDKISDVIFQVDKPTTPGYTIEVEQVASTLATEEKIDIASLLAMGDIAHGEKQFKKCKACHSIKQGGGNKIGPKLWNVMFRQVGAVNDYKYSKALSSYNKEWNWEEMNGFLIKPAKWIPNNKMGFAGLKSEKDRASVILYLNQNSDNPQPLP